MDIANEQMGTAKAIGNTTAAQIVYDDVKEVYNNIKVFQMGGIVLW